MGAERMSAVDAAWLRVDSRENPMVVTAVLWFGGPLDLGELRARLAGRLVDANPRFRSTVRPGPLPLLPPVWVPDPAFDLDRHLTHIDLTRIDLTGIDLAHPEAHSEPTGDDDAGDDAALGRLVGEVRGRQLDPTAAPPWRLVLVDGYRPAAGAPPRSVLVAQLHHTLADGAALVRLLLDLTDPSAPDEPRAGVAPAAAAPAAAAPAAVAPPGAARVAPAPAPVRTAAQLAGLALAVPLTALRFLLMAPEPRTPLRGRLGVRKDAAWGEPRSLDRVKASAAASGATVNDVLLAAVAGGFRRHLARLGASPLPAQLRVYVPVDVSAGAPGLGNRFGLLPLRLPVAELDPRRRVRQIAAATRAVKRSPVPAATYVLIGVLGVVPEAVRSLVVQLLGSRATAIVTNVPGPREPVTLARVPLDGVAFWVPQAAAVGVGVSLFSYAGTIRIGVAVDAGLVPDAQQLADALDAELDELLRDTPSPTPPQATAASA
jgi:diacylglycerol O-acyltransferase